MTSNTGTKARVLTNYCITNMINIASDFTSYPHSVTSHCKNFKFTPETLFVLRGYQPSLRGIILLDLRIFVVKSMSKIALMKNQSIYVFIINK